MSRAINRAIEHSHRRGVLSSCSLLVTGADFAHAIQASQRCPGLGIGLHLSLTTSLVSSSERVPSLADAIRVVTALLEEFHVGKLNRRAVATKVEAIEQSVPQSEIQTEFESQLVQFVTALGRLPTHLDTHQHIHMRRSVYGAVIAMALRHSIPVRQLSESMKHDLRARGIATTDRFIEVPSDVQTVESGLRFVEQHWQDAGVTELLVHPGFRDRDRSTTTAFDLCRPIHLRLLLAAAAHGMMTSRPSTYDLVHAASSGPTDRQERTGR
jgi:predicted glycoside hydrolase/deacetylase ChbG (UPF0249 family)